jgi:hypothetical protein
MVRVDVEGEDGGTFISKAAALASLGAKYMLEVLVKSTERLRRVCGMAKSNTTSSSSGKYVVEEDTAYVQLFDPVLVFIKTDTSSDKHHKYVTMSMGVGVILSMSNKTVGSGPLSLMPEHAFATEETKVEVHLAKVSAAGEDDDFFEVYTNQFVTAKPLSFKGNEFVFLVKPQVVQDEAGSSLYRLKKKDLEGSLDIFAELFEDLRVQKKLPQKLPQGPSKLLPEPVAKRMVLEEKPSSEYECDLCENPKTVMKKKDLRLHVAGHALKGGFHKVVGERLCLSVRVGFVGSPLPLVAAPSTSRRPSKGSAWWSRPVTRSWAT